jgi:hypothetical protein
MNPVVDMLDTGLKTSQLPVETVTDESGFKASKASAIGAGGVSAQIAKPTKTMRRESRILRITLYLRRICYPCSTLLCYTMLLLSFCFHYVLSARYHILTELKSSERFPSRLRLGRIYRWPADLDNETG